MASGGANSSRSSSSSSGSSRGYRTLPSGFRRFEDGGGANNVPCPVGESVVFGRVKKKSTSGSCSTAASPTPGGPNGGGRELFGGLHLNLGLGSLISGGISLLGQLRRRTPSSSSSPSLASSPPPLLSSSSSGSDTAFFSARLELPSLTISSTSGPLTEFIEMTSLAADRAVSPRGEDCVDPPAVPEGGDPGEEQVGRGHDFAPVRTFNPTWCDLCRDLVWGLYDTGATRCIRCHLTCHVKCQSKIRLNCVSATLRDHHHVLDDLSVKGRRMTTTTTVSPPDRVLVVSGGGPRSPSSIVLSLSSSSPTSSSSSSSTTSALDHDESTMANISTLQDEVVAVRPPPDTFSDGDEDDECITLKDVSKLEDFALDLDGSGVGAENQQVKAAEDEEDEGNTLLDDEADDGGNGGDDDDDDDGNNSRDQHHKQQGTSYRTSTFNTSDLNKCMDALRKTASSPAQLVDSEALAAYNLLFPPGQETAIFRDGCQGVVDDNLARYRGYIRVVLNLRRPINVLPGTKPPSVYNISGPGQGGSLSNSLKRSEDQGCSSRSGRTRPTARLTSFYLPSDTVKSLHVDSHTTVRDVIRSMLAKFRIVDNPHKFALYEKPSSAHSEAARQVQQQPTTSTSSARSDGTRSRRTLVRHNLRKMGDEEQPLLLALLRTRQEGLAGSAMGVGGPLEETGAPVAPQQQCCYFVLQENDPGEICWESFTVPELRNFLRILDREEAWYKKRIHEKYETAHKRMVDLLEEKLIQMAEEEGANVSEC